MLIKAREIWKLITTINNVRYNFNKSYYISNYGNVKSVGVNGKIKYLQKRKTRDSRTGKIKPYKRVVLYYTDDKGLKLCKDVEIHRIVAEHFIMTDENQSALQVDHLNDDGSDNYYKNLEYVTSYENMQRALDRGKLGRGHKNKLAVLTEDQVHIICGRLKNCDGVNLIAVDMNIAKSTVSSISRGVNWKHISKLYNIEYTSSKNKIRTA